MEYLRKIKINPGAEVSGEDFFNRDKEFGAFKKRLNSTSHIVFSQIRRTGKTSFMKEFIQRNTDYPIAYVIVQGCQNELEFYIQIYKATIDLSRKLKTLNSIKTKWNKISEIIPEVKGVKLGQIKYTTEQICSKLIKLTHENELILFIDEFPDFILNLKKNESVEPFLANFRVFRNKCSKLKTVLTGSINLSRTIKMLGLADKLNEYRTFKFPLFSPEDSLLFLQCLIYSEDYTIDEQAKEYIFSLIKDGMPYFIQLLADEVQQLEVTSRELKEADLKIAIEAVFNSDEFGLDEFHTRLNTYLKEEKLEKPAKIILSHLSHAEMEFEDLYPYVDKYVTKEKLDKLLNRLQDEAYITKEDDKYSFLSNLLAGWWNKNKHFDRS